MDTLSGEIRDYSLLVALLFLFFTKIISANYIGIFFTLPLYYFLYFFTAKTQTLSFTNRRVLISSEYKFPRIVKGFGNTLIITCFMILGIVIKPDLFGNSTVRLLRLQFLFDFMGISSILFYQYKLFYLANDRSLVIFDAVITIVINLWYAFQYWSITYEFKEIHISHISEQLTTVIDRTNVVDHTILLILIIVLDAFVFGRFSYLVLIFALLIFRNIPRPKVAKVSFFGSTSRELIRDLIVSPNDYPILKRVTSNIFGWNITKSRDEKRSFPETLVPHEIVGTYETGLQASLKTSQDQANIIGGTISTIINMIIIFLLARFAILYLPSELDTVILIGISLVGISVIYALLMYLISTIRVQIRSEEKLLIGSSFIARYISPSLWILKGEKMAGTSVQRGAGQPLFKIDRVKGLIINWRKLAIFLFITGMITITLIWNYLGGLNLPLLLEIFPSLIGLSLQSIADRAAAELGILIISGYILWFLILFIYPQIYARTRPSLFIEMEHSSISPIILKNFSEYQEASHQFTRSLLSSSQDPRKNKIGRPGVFLIRIKLVEYQLGKGDLLTFEAGENRIKYRNDLPMEIPHLLYDYLLVSGLRGYPSVKLKIKLFTGSQLLWTNEVKLNLLYENYLETRVDLGSYGHISLHLSIIDKKA